MVVQLLSNKEDAFEDIRILWSDVIDTTGVYNHSKQKKYVGCQFATFVQIGVLLLI